MAKTTDTPKLAATEQQDRADLLAGRHLRHCTEITKLRREIRRCLTGCQDTLDRNSSETMFLARGTLHEWVLRIHTLGLQLDEILVAFYCDEEELRALGEEHPS